jgi:hypothetical protein
MGIRPIGATVGGLLGAALGVRETLFVVTVAQLLGALFLVALRSPVLQLRDMPEQGDPGASADLGAQGAPRAP